MAKMFYTLEEACAKLGKDEKQVKDMVTRGQLSEFRDRDRLMFKSEQVDLLSSSTGSSKIDEVFKLADSGETEAISLANSGSQSAIRVTDTPVNSQPNQKEQTGISIFEAEDTEENDPSAVTRVTPSLAGGTALGGSGLLEATRDGGDSAMGVDMIKDSFGTGQNSALAGSGAMANDGAMFEGAPSEAVTPAPLLAAMAEPYDAAGSGLVGGLALGMVLTLGIGMMAVLLAMTGGSSLLETLGENMMILVGVGAAVTVIAAVAGWFMGRRG